MTREPRPTATISATIKSKAQEENGYKIELIVPSFKGQYPTTVNRVPEEVATRLITGKTYTLTLEQQNLRKKKDGTSYDGSQPWMYWWGLDDVPDQTSIFPEEEEQDAERPQAPRAQPPDRQDLIMLQHASGVVAQAYGDWNRLPPGTRGTFSDYLKAVAMGATWYLRQVYQKGGYFAVTQDSIYEAGGDDAELDPPF